MMRQIVVDVSLEADLFHYSFMLQGAVSLWAADIKISEATGDIPTTDVRKRRHEQPITLDFSAVASPTN
jgi:hypothetical protein